MEKSIFRKVGLEGFMKDGIGLLSRKELMGMFIHTPFTPFSEGWGSQILLFIAQKSNDLSKF